MVRGECRCEYVVGMLIRLEKVSEDDVERLLAQFAELDKTGDGLLSHDDICR